MKAAFIFRFLALSLMLIGPMVADLLSARCSSKRPRHLLQFQSKTR